MSDNIRPLDRVHACLAEHGVDIQDSDVELLCTLSGAPANMVGWRGFSRGLPRILTALTAIYPPAHEWPLAAWEAWANLLASDAGRVCERLTPRAPQPSSSGAAKKAIHTYPVYGALTAPCLSEFEPGVRVLQALILALHAKHLERHSFLPQIRELSLIIRMCAGGKADYLPIAKLLPHHVADLSELRRLFSQRKFTTNSLERHRKSLLVAMKIIGSGFLAPMSASIPDTRIVSLAKKHERVHCIEPVDGKQEIHPVPVTPSGGIIEAGDLQGESDDGLSAQERHALVEGRAARPGMPPTSFQTDIEHAKTVQRAVARANQRLPAEWRAPTQCDISTLLTAMQGTESDSLAPGARLALCLLLACGSATPALRVVSMIDQFPVERGLFTLGLLDRVWAASLPVPSDGYKPTEAERAYLDPVENVLRLPAPELLISAATALLPNGGVFQADEQHLSDLKSWLRGLNKAYGCRLTIGRIARSLQWALQVLTDDAVEIAMLTGDVDDCRHSGLYYYAPDSARLVSLYCLAWNAMVETTATVFGQERLMADDRSRPLANSRRVGTPLHPSERALQQFAGALKQWVVDKPARLRSQRETSSYHNRYTVYTATLLQFATGGRPVRSFFARQQDVQLDAGIAILSDKDYRDARSTRLVPLPAIAIEQLQRYRQHVATLRKRLPLIKLPPEGDDAPLLFLLNAKGNPREIAPSDLTRYRKRFWQLPENTHRHWYRTALREAGISAEMVDSVMGHARYMQGTYDPYSALAPAELVQAVAPAVEKLLTAMGWESLRGLHG